MRTRTCVAVLLLAATACSNNGTTTGPSVTATSSTTLALNGTVTGGNAFSGTAPAPTPIAGARLTIIDGPNAGKAATTDPSGRYSFTGLQQSGFTVSVSADGYVSRTGSITLTSNQTLDFDLTRPPATIVLSGRVIDASTTAPIAGAVVSINGRYQGMTDRTGNYTVTGLLDAGRNANFTFVSVSGYASDYRHIQGTTQNVHLYRIERITAGDSKVVTVEPDDTLCVNNSQDEPGSATNVCRSVRVSATRDGVMMVEALSTQEGTRPPIEVEINGEPVDWNLRNPTSPFSVTAGSEVVVNVEMPATSPTRQSFVVKTSITPP